MLPVRSEEATLEIQLNLRKDMKLYRRSHQVMKNREAHLFEKLPKLSQKRQGERQGAGGSLRLGSGVGGWEEMVGKPEGTKAGIKMGRREREEEER